LRAYCRAVITAWYSNCTAHNRKALQRVVRSAQRITVGKLPALQDTYTTRCHRKAKKITKDNSYPEPLPVHPATIQKMRSVQVHQSWDRETEKQLLSQGHQTVKQLSLNTKRLHKQTIFYTIYWILPMMLCHCSSIYLYVYILIPFLHLDVCIR
jgi:hypothetical protein